ncbi:MAG TPA: Na+/H+ antiporter NhaA [Acidimicrobiia bacterium]|nr:Na+/H+ antiporter NhaA [Acidimicrobiia bacterium]
MPRAQAVVQFLRTETAGGVALLAATVAAMVWINIAPVSYADTWQHKEWINDGLMLLFFFVVGLEIKREIVSGELRQPRTAALPAIAAVGGMVVPALLFLAVMRGSDGAHGWGIPMATDIAFAVGVLALIGRGLAPGTKIFLLALAIVDDIGAIIVIALFYGHGWGGARTVGAVALALCIPVRTRSGARPAERIEESLHPVVSFAIVPLFALANAGIRLGGDALRDGFGSRLTWAVIIGLVVGKLIGVSGAATLAVRTRAGERPAGVGRRETAGIAALAGIGFTVALFVSELAYEGKAGQLSDAKLGIFVASLTSALIGSAILRAGSSRTSIEK